MRKYISICFLLIGLTGSAQLPGEGRRDSLRRLLQTLPEDSDRVMTLVAYARTYSYNDIARGIPALDSAITLAKKIAWPSGLARAFIQMGRAVSDTGNNLLSNEFYQRALEIDLKSGNRRFIAIDLSYLAQAYNRESDFPNALKYGLQAVDIAETLHNDSLTANVMSNVAITYLNHKNYPKGLEWVLKGKALAERSGAPGELIDALQHLAYIRYHDKDKPEVKRLLRQALAIAETLDEPVTRGSVLSQLGEAEMDSPATALKHLYEARAIFSRLGPKSMRHADALSLLGKVFADTAYRSSGARQRALLDSAIACEKQAEQILIRAGNHQYLSDIYDLLSEFESNLGHFREAYRYDVISGNIYDSLFSEKKKKELAGLQRAHDLEIKDRELQLRRLEAIDRKRILIGVTAGILFAAIIVLMLVRQSRQRKRSNSTLLVLNNQLEEANNVKARFFGILSHDLRSPVANLVSFLDLVKNEPDAISAEDKMHHQRQISRSAEELLDTMEAMLLWSKEQMDSFRPDIKMIPVSDLFSYLQKFFGSAQGTLLRFENPDNLQVSGDENYLRVIMQNLTSNAFKALNNHAAGIIEWKAYRKGSQTVLAVTDNGPGLNQDQARALYTETTAANARSGFGFHLIRDLAKAIHFSISIDSEPGRGTTFELQS